MARKAVLMLLLAAGAVAQRKPFTIDDALDARSVSIEDLSDDGRRVALRVAAQRERIGIDNSRFGDPSYIAPFRAELLVFETAPGTHQKLFPAPRVFRGASWSPGAARLALLAQEWDRFELFMWDRARRAIERVELPRGRIVADNAQLEWSRDGKALVVALREVAWLDQARERFRRETAGPVLLYSSKEPFLNWEALRRMSAVRSLWALEPATGQWRELVKQTSIGPYHLTEDAGQLVWSEDVTKKTDYDVIFGSEHRVKAQPFAGGEAKTVVASTKAITLMWSRDGRTYAYSKEGGIYAGTLDDREARFLLGRKPESSAKPDEEKSDEKTPPERFSAVRLSPDGRRLVVSNKEGLWVADTAKGEKTLVAKMPEEDKLAPRYAASAWSPDGGAIYLAYSSRTAWERGLDKYDIAASKMETLVRDGRRYQDWTLSRDGTTWAFTIAEGARPGDVWTAASAVDNARRLSDANPWLEQRLLPKAEQVRYLDADGKTLHGVLYYPAEYEKGKKYPTVFIVYEQFFDETFNGMVHLLANNGYAVFTPSVEFETGHPGEAWVKGVTSAANKLIEMGVADGEKLGVHGTSYGGYATNLLITQTSRFKAAINISGKVNVVSFYTDSPRLGVRNIHAPEKSQDRIGGTLWQHPLKYLEHSAVLFADRIKTPLLLITGEQDHNVPARQAMEMYYALRRLGKRVEWVNYVHGGHGVPMNSLEDYRDFHARVLRWYDELLKAPKSKEAPVPSGQP